MERNNKGFMLAEVIVTSTIVLTVMVSLYSSFNRLYNNYQKRNYYYHIDGFYATKIVVDELLNVGLNSYINNMNDSYGYLINKSNGLGVCGKRCNAVSSFYNVEKMVLVEYSESSINAFKESFIDNSTGKVLDQTFVEYLDYLSTYYNNFESNDYDYIVLTEVVDNGSNYYSNLRLR